MEANGQAGVIANFRSLGLLAAGVVGAAALFVIMISI